MLQKANKKSFTSVAVQSVCLGVGMKVGDGIAAIAPESTESYKHWLIGLVGVGLAAFINPTTTGGQALQSAVLGIGVGGFYNGITEAISPSVPVQDPTSRVGRFVNAVVGHKPDVLDAAAQDASLGAALWEPTYEVASEWERPEEQRTLKIALG